jgi:hypothetical protein
MGNLSNLYISRSFQSLIHLGSDTNATSTLTLLQDGLGNSIGVGVNTSGDVFLSGSLTASLQQGYVWVGDNNGKTKTIATSSLVVNVDTSSLVTTASFNAFTSSTNISIANLNVSSASQQDSINNLNSFTASATGLSTGSLLVTASFDNGTRNLTFTKGNNTTFAVNIPDVSGSTINTGSFATTGSNTFTGTNIFEQQVDIKNASGLLLYSNTNNVSDATGIRNESGSLLLVKIGTANKVDLQNLSLLVSGTFTASLQQGFTYVGDASGKTVLVATASFATTGSNVFVGNQTFTGSLFVSGNINMVNGADLVTHHVRAAGSNGLELQTSAGTIIVAMGQGGGTQAQFVGAVSANSISASTINGLGDPLAFSQSVDTRLDAFEAVSSSYARTNINNTFGGTQNFLNIAVAGTASIAYLESVTGSAKIIGDAFIILNNDTPAQRYAGIIVQDSGSTQTTASFEFDGQTNDWFYGYSDDGGVTQDFGVTLFGPEYNTKGSPTYLTNNRIPKAVGSHHLNDSQISDDGTTVTITNAISASTFTGLGNLTTYSTSVNSRIVSLTSNTGSYATTGSNTLIGDQYISNGALQVATYPQTTKQWFSPTAIEAIGTSSVAIEQYVDGGNYDTFNVTSTLNSGTDFRDTNSSTFVQNTWLNIPTNTGNNPAPQFKRGLSVTGSTNIQQLTVIGNSIFTGSARANVVSLSITSNTASMDLSLGNYFTLTLVNTATTHISASNVQPGQSATLVITTGTNSSASLAPTMLQPSGSAYSASLGSSKLDVLSIVSVANGVPFVVSTKNMV